MEPIEEEDTIEDNLSEGDKLDQVVEIKEIRPRWPYFLGGAVILLIISLVGFYVVRTYFINEKQNSGQEDVGASTELSPEALEAQKKMEEAFKKMAEQSSPEYILENVYENFKKVHSFYYHEEIAREDVEESKTVQHIIKSYPTDIKKAYVILPGIVFLRNNYFTEIALEDNQVYIKNDAILDNYTRSYSINTVNQQNLNDNERLVFELTNLQFSWLNPALIKEYEKKERKNEDGHKYTIFYVNYDSEKLKMFWAEKMNSQIKKPYLEGFDLSLPNLQINYQGEIWIEDSQTPLPNKIIINRSFRYKKDSQTDYLNKITSYINFKEYNQPYSASASSLVYGDATLDVYRKDIVKDQNSSLVVDGDAPLAFPIHAGSMFISGLNVDGLDFFVYNPFDWPIDIVLQQSLPQGVSVDNATFDWTIEENKIVWHYLLDPKQVISFRVNLKLETEKPVDMPQAELTVSAQQLTKPLQFICPEKLQIGKQ